MYTLREPRHVPDMKITLAIDIDRPPDRVFPWLAEPERAMAWMSSVSRTEILHRTPELVGTTFRETVADERGSTELRGVITACRPDRLLAFRLEGAFNDVDVAYHLEDDRNGTRLTMRAEVRFKGLVKWLSLLLGPVFKRKVMRQTAKELSALKRLCEGEG